MKCPIAVTIAVICQSCWVQTDPLHVVFTGGYQGFSTGQNKHSQCKWIMVTFGEQCEATIPRVKLEPWPEMYLLADTWDVHSTALPWVQKFIVSLGEARPLCCYIATFAVVLGALKAAFIQSISCLRSSASPSSEGYVQLPFCKFVFCCVVVQ